MTAGAQPLSSLITVLPPTHIPPPPQHTHSRIVWWRLLRSLQAPLLTLAGAARMHSRMRTHAPRTDIGGATSSWSYKTPRTVYLRSQSSLCQFTASRRHSAQNSNTHFPFLYQAKESSLKTSGPTHIQATHQGRIAGHDGRPPPTWSSV